MRICFIYISRIIPYRKIPASLFLKLFRFDPLDFEDVMLACEPNLFEPEFCIPESMDGKRRC